MNNDVADFYNVALPTLIITALGVMMVGFASGIILGVVTAAICLLYQIMRLVRILVARPGCRCSTPRRE